MSGGRAAGGAFPMFPLGTVLLPGAPLPLHVFEPRYRKLVHDLLAGHVPGGELPSFGVVLIERGSEVGGGDVRTDVGTTALLAEVAELPDGRFALGCVGGERFRVNEWLPDDPYPRAAIELWPERSDDAEAERELAEQVERDLRRLLGLRAEVGDAVAPATTPISGDLAETSYQLARLAPIGPADRQRLLVAPSVGARLELLAAMLAEELEVVQRRMDAG